MVNQLIPLIIGIILFFTSVDILIEEYRFVLSSFIYIGLLSISWGLNLWGRDQLARPLMSIILISIPFYYSAFLNQESGIALIYIAVACGQFMIFDFHERWKIALFISLCIALLLFIEGVNYEIIPGTEKLPMSYQKNHFKLFIIADIISLGLACFWLVKENQTSEGHLVVQKTSAEEELKSKSEFLSIMSHEIRTPLSGIIGITDILLSSELPDKSMENLKVLKYSANNLLNTVNDILDFSKLEAEKVVIENTSISIESFFSDVASTVSHRIKNNNIKFRLDFDSSIPKHLKGDPTRLHQVLINLLDNAIKFTHYGHISFSAKQIALTENQCIIKFSIEDTGIGIPKEKLESIFDSFTQASSSTSRRYGGSGLGIYLCKKIITLLGGQLKVKSDINKGSTFSFEIPFEIDNTPKQTASIPLISPVSFRGLRALVVEDNLINQFVIKQVLQNHHISYHAVENGNKAIDALNKRNYDLVLLDYHMPDLDGLQTLSKIRDRASQVIDRNIPVIILTADMMDDVKHRVIAAGANAFVSKPLKQEELLFCIKQIIEERDIELRDSQIELNFIDSNIDKYFDISYVKGVIGEDPAVIRTLVEMVLEKTPQQLNDLKNNLSSNNKEVQIRLSHDIKSNLKNIGLLTISNRMGEIENTIRENGNIHKDLNLVETEYGKAEEEIKEWLKTI